MMEHLINPRVREIEISGIRRFSNLVAQYQDAVSLTIGQPDFPTPQHVKDAALQAIRNNHTVYTHNAGLPALREAAARFMESKYGLNYDPVEEVIVTTGASEAIDVSLRTILEEGSEVILPGPVYPGYEPVIRMCGAVPVFVDTRQDGFRVTASSLKEKINERTRCIILPYPSNPTGQVLTEKELQEIAHLLKDREIWVLSDEIYSELVYEGGHQSIASIPGMKEKTIVINGLSKSHSMTGWRIGLLFAPQTLARQMLKVHQYNVTCASSISQYAAIEALTNGIDDALPMKQEYRQRRDYVVERLGEIGLPVITPRGAFYVFPSIAATNLDSFTFASKLLERDKLAVVPGSAFSGYGEGYIRISYAYSMDVLKEGLDRLQRFMERLS